PIPPAIIDALIAMNISISFILLMVAMYIPSPLHLSTFPALLLYTTLYRLSLNITTTRMILLKAQAGEIIFTFGNFVVGGNFAVGAVIFLIITIVQFLVIAKGAERVSEVSARFTLDAMPGKQMSIDADMRAGTIEMGEAKRRRSDLEKESQLYGAMDGAMKFIKGDAIAGLIIVVINIIGGISIGVMQKGMTVSQALVKYSILTIGDGLISQIPSLMICITSGTIVTRVSTQDDSNLGTDIANQLLGQPKALLITSGVLVGFGLIPGFPEIQFFLLAAIFGFTGYILNKKSFDSGIEKEESMPSASAAGKEPRPIKTSKDDEFMLTIPIMLDVSEKLKKYVSTKELNDELIKIRKALYLDLGVPFPGINLRFNDDLKETEYNIYLDEIPISQGYYMPGMILSRENEENLKVLNIEYKVDKPFLPNIPSIWVDEKYKEQFLKANISFMGVCQIFTYHLSYILKKYASSFLGIQEVKYLISQMEKSFSELLKEVQRTLPIQTITDILQRLVSEELSIRNLRSIFQSLLEWGQKERDIILLTEYVRMSALKRYICYKYSGGENMLGAYMLDSDVEDSIRSSIRQTSGGSYLAMDPNSTKTILNNIKSEIGDINKLSRKPVLLVTMDIRRYVKKMIEIEIPDLAVISYQELISEISVQPLGKITL
ncbi:MAG: type III secretion system export apparatus subunit SctV, partial [Desulfobacterales bacterium]|nr:type III secretion system export apparatus subunit SctV [Desulfobacterales bacterium]